MTSDPPAQLPRSSPERHGVPSAAIEAFLDQLEADGVELHSIMLLRHQTVLVEGWWAPYTRDGVQLLYSLSKSFTATAVGLAVAENRLSLDEPVSRFFPQDQVESLHPRVQRMQVRHLLSMATGHHIDTRPLMLAAAAPAAAFLAVVPEEEPGSWFTYHNGASLMLSLIVTAVSGERLLEYLRPRLLDPLGIGEAWWLGTESVDQGYSGLYLTTESIARFGQLYLRGGVWDGRRLLPDGWVTAATRLQVDSPREPHPDWRQGYGYQFWRCRHGSYRGDGAFGQFCVVLPEHDVVLVTTAAVEDMQTVLDALWQRLLPAFRADSVPEANDSRLEDRLAALTLPVVRGDAEPATTHQSRGSGAGGWSATSLRADGEQPVSRLDLSPAADGGWLLSITDARATYQVPCGHGQWRSGEHLLGQALLRTAACGAWTAAATFRAEIAFISTPHRMEVVADFGAGTVQARWRIAPLDAVGGSELAVPARARR
ncbi:MAG TPA: serine hydrolase domain-containing protein [Propionibacteriaceae bacterium]|nr:serine hydrolase domain-containing protein [Propionibacteriaceae bacterium]